MTRVKIDPGTCGFKTVVTAQMNDDDMAEVKVSSGCKAVMDMMGEVDNELGPYEICLVKPGTGPLFGYASEQFPVHAGCPVLSGITKCIEAEAGLALQHNVKITFEKTPGSRGEKNMAITVNLYYTGTNGNARKFAKEMESSGTAEAIRAEDGNLRYEYFFPMNDPETVLLIDSWRDQEAIDAHHASPMMGKIAALREKYDLHMTVERFASADIPEAEGRFVRK